MEQKNATHPGVAAVLSFIFNGLGQLYNGEISKGLLIFSFFLRDTHSPYRQHSNGFMVLGQTGFLQNFNYGCGFISGGINSHLHSWNIQYL